MKYNVVVIGIGNVGFSLIELLYEKHKNLNIFAFDIKKPKYLKPFLERKTFNFIKVDVTNRDLFEKSINFHKINNINLLVSSVGILSRFKEINKFKEEFDINFFGNIIPIKILLKKIPKKSNNRIIILGSTAGNFAVKSMNSYSPSKFALESFSSSLQHELKTDEIHVDIIRPSNIINKHSSSFKINKGIQIGKVVNEIYFLMNKKFSERKINSVKRFIPKYFFIVRILERVFPWVLNFIYGLNLNIFRAHSYKRYKLRKILITGGSSGLGLDLAKLYSIICEEIIITGRDFKKLERVKKELSENSNCKIITKIIDFSSIKDTLIFSKEIDNIDMIINNAGQYLSKSVELTTIDDYHQLFNSNFLSPVILSECSFLKVGPKKIINILSTTAISGRRNHSAYSSSKSALWAYTKALRRRVGGNTHILEVIPSTFKSNLFRELENIDSNHGLIDSKFIAEKILKAEQKGKDILYIPLKSKLFMLTESLVHPLFKRIFLK